MVGHIAVRVLLGLFLVAQLRHTVGCIVVAELPELAQALCNIQEAYFLNIQLERNQYLDLSPDEFLSHRN